MPKYVALLRGINVGGNHKVEMSKLKKVFESFGCENVQTYINSGNVVFENSETDVQKLTNEIEKSLKMKFGFEVRVVVRDQKNILNLCKKLPKNLTNDSQMKADVLFLWDKFDNKKSVDLIKINKEVDNLLYIKGAIVWSVDREVYNKSAMHKFIGTEIYKHMTARNVNTVRKLGEMMK